MSVHESARPIHLTERDRWLSECSCGWEQIARTETEARLAWKNHKSAMDEQTERLTLSNDSSRNVGDVVLVADCFESPDAPSRFAEFIATCDPPTVLALVEIARAAQALQETEWWAFIGWEPSSHRQQAIEGCQESLAAALARLNTKEGN